MPKFKSTVIVPVSLLCIFLFSSFGPIKFSRTKLSDGVSALIPKGWRPMDDLDFSERYPSVRAPLGAYTSEDRMVDFSVNISATQWPDTDTHIAERFFRASIMNMFDRVEMINEGRQTVNGKEFIFFEFESTVRGNRTSLGQQRSILKYIYIQYLITPGRTLVFSFQCPRQLRNDWQEAAHKMMGSIKVKKQKPAEE